MDKLIRKQMERIYAEIGDLLKMMDNEHEGEGIADPPREIVVPDRLHPWRNAAIEEVLDANYRLKRLEAPAIGAMRNREVLAVLRECGRDNSEFNVSDYLAKLAKADRVERVEHGWYRALDTPTPFKRYEEAAIRTAPRRQLSLRPRLRGRFPHHTLQDPGTLAPAAMPPPGSRPRLRAGDRPLWQSESVARRPSGDSGLARAVPRTRGGDGSCSPFATEAIVQPLALSFARPFGADQSLSAR